jgi:NADPH:quinone reductase
MKAIRVEQHGEPDVMKLMDVAEPKVTAGKVLVEIKAAGVSPVEAYIRAGWFGLTATLPYTPGSDGAGIVREIGSGVDHVRPGDKVFVTGSDTGTYAELALCAASAVHLLPKVIGFAEGAAVGVAYSTAYRALFIRAKIEAGETVLIHGASGGVGTAAVQLASNAGARVFGTASSPKGREIVLGLGAERVFDHKNVSYRRAILDATDGQGVNCIMEMLANVNLGEDLRLLAFHGRVIVVGNRGRVEIDPRDTMVRDADIRGMSLLNAPPDELAGIHRALIEGLEKGTIRPVIEREVGLSEAPEAHRAVMSHEAHGKILLIP